MQVHGSDALLIKRPFDLQEAVVLLDVYLSMVKTGVPITKAAEKASVRLRGFAKSRGYEISDSFRSAGGLVNRLRSLRGLYEGMNQNLLREPLCLRKRFHSIKTTGLSMKKS